MVRQWRTCPQGHGTIIRKRSESEYQEEAYTTNWCPICNVIYPREQMIVTEEDA
jgi:hypothetical protein